MARAQLGRHWPLRRRKVNADQLPEGVLLAFSGFGLWSVGWVARYGGCSRLLEFEFKDEGLGCL